MLATSGVVAFVGRAGRCRRRAIHSLQAPYFNLFRQGSRGQILVELPGFRFRDVAIGHGAHDDPLLAAERPADFQFVAGSDQPVWLRGLSVDVNLAAFAGLLLFRTRPEQTRDIEPDIQPDPVPLVTWRHGASEWKTTNERSVAPMFAQPARAIASSKSRAVDDMSCGL